IQLVLHLPHVLCRWIKNQAILKYHPCLVAGFDRLDLRQKVLPLVVGLDLVGIETFDAGKQADTAGIAGPNDVLRIGKEITGNQGDPPWQSAFLDQIRQKIELLKEMRAIVAVEVVVDE